MNQKEIVKRYLFFMAGLFVNSFGVSFVTKANLGTSPISSIPYTLSLGFKPTLGQFTLYFSIILILIQFIILRKNFPKQYLLQIPVSFLFSFFIDFSMQLLDFLKPEAYLMKLIYLLIGCFILGVGVFMEVVADVVMLPGESFVKAITITFHKDFGKTKIIFDSTMSLIAALLAIILFHNLVGVREGTVIAAALVGLIARFLNKKIGWIQKYLIADNNRKDENADVKDSDSKSGMIITISREYGSGGHSIGEMLAKELGFAFYDKDIIDLTAKENNQPIEYIEENEQSMTNSFLYDLVAQYYSDPSMKAPLEDVFEKEKKIIKNLAEKGNCVIVGRCADYILKEYEKCYHIFIYAEEKFKTNQIAERMNLNELDAKKEMKSIDKKRMNHYKYFTGQSFGRSQNYHLSINSGTLGIEKSVGIIKEFIQSV